VFIPFLKEENAVTFSGVTPSLLTKFQDRLLSGGNIPVTVNRNMRLVRRMFPHLVSRGGLAENPCDKVTPIPDVPETHKARGCYELDSLKGVFDEEWEDKTSYLLCLLMYGTNLRNCEIRRLKGGHIAAVEDCHFIDVRVSKTRNGVRHRPLHEFIRVKLAGYMAERGIEPDEYVFSHLSGRVFRKAYLTMGERLGKSGDDLKAENISFYSGRHFWKTLMNAGNLGEDAEEYWMGHAVSGDVAKTYNHRDKQGREVMLGKTREAFAILDRYLFGAPEAG
jgi:integrase